MTHADLIATVGRTPLVELRRLAKDLPGRVLAKLEMRNPCENVKDRVAVALVQDAESRGPLKSGMTIVEATGGNTGIGLAFVCAIRGYRLILTMPETKCARRLAREEGIIAGVSSGAAVHAALAIAARQDAAGKIIVVILADTGERYIITSLFSAGAEQP
jgi:cysteine synthase